MPDDTEWVTRAITNAKLESTTKDDAVWSLLENFLNGDLRTRPLTAMQLQAVARQLMDAMDSTTQTPEEPR